MKNSLVTALSIALACWFFPESLRGQNADGGGVDLFDGETLDGWAVRGGAANFRVEDGAIVGSTVPKTPNTFLCTEKSYGDFELELEFKGDPRLNSGVQIRSNSLPGFKEGRVHGYQVEIDPSDRAWTGGIYEEGRRGWLYDLSHNDGARFAVVPGEWNHLRVRCIGDSIRTWINGVSAASLVDSMTQRGFIGLQVHGVGTLEDTLEMRWRNIRIKDLGLSRWTPLFNGSNFEGWMPPKTGTWKVENGILRAVSRASESAAGHLLTARKFDNFTARIVYRANKGNSGFCFRIDPEAEDSPGYEAEIDAAGKDAGGICECVGGEWVQRPSPAAANIVFGAGEWNEMTVSAHGNRVVVHLNGVKTSDVRKTLARREGFLGIELAGGQDADIEFKSIEILSSPAARPARAAPPKKDEPLPPVVPAGAVVEKLAEGFTFTEGPALAIDGRLFFSDIPNERIHIYDPATGEVSVHRENSGRANGLMFAPTRALFACEGGNRRVTRQTGDEIAVVADAYQGKKLNSPNDLELDNFGGIYFTDPRYGRDRSDMELDLEAVYYVDRRRQVKRVIEDVVKPNGIIFSPDYRTLYVADPGARKIWAYDVEVPGTPTNKRELASVGSDGMTVDERGNVYCTFEGEIWIFSPKGEEIARVPCPERPANCTFGGPDGKTLFITARTGLYGIELNVRGGRFARIHRQKSP